MGRSILRDYTPLPPMPHPARAAVLKAYYTPELERTPEQTAALDAEIKRARMTTNKAERILKAWVRKGFAPFSAMDIAELELLKRAHGSLEAAYDKIIGVD